MKHLDIKQLPEPSYRGKVRDLYFIDDTSMLICASDRISAFDVIFPDPMENKGVVLTTISLLWFEKLRSSGLGAKLGFGDHLISTNPADFPEPFNQIQYLAGRSMYVKRVKRIDFECVVRGYIAGSGWKDYQKTGAICGHKLPAGLELSAKLPEPIFTPATKAAEGEHDENVSVEYMADKLGADLTAKLENISIEIYKYAAELLSTVGIILCDTKFEFGLDEDGGIVLIDEVLTPDSSRYWEASTVRLGESPPSFDKQIVRDHLENSGWNKQPPAPGIPAEVMEKTMSQYDEIKTRLEKLVAAST